MAKSRLELQSRLEEIIGSRNVYYQPPESVKIKYPAMVYSLSNIKGRYADNAGYNRIREYQLTLIDKNPDSELIDKVLELPLCSFSTHYTSENLHHFIFNLYW